MAVSIQTAHPFTDVRQPQSRRMRMRIFCEPFQWHVTTRVMAGITLAFVPLSGRLGKCRYTAVQPAPKKAIRGRSRWVIPAQRLLKMTA